MSRKKAPPRPGSRRFPKKTAKAKKRGARNRKRRTLPREFLDDEELAAMFDACGDKPNGCRDRALIAILEGCGCRISEALDLLPRDLDWKGRTANIRHGKGDKQRIVPIASSSLRRVRAWLDLRETLKIGKSAPICCSLKGARVSTSYVRQHLPTLARRAGIEKRVHAHGIRHRFAIRMVRKGVPLTSISYVLGHTSTMTTNEYLKRIGAPPAIADVQRALEGAA